MDDFNLDTILYYFVFGVIGSVVMTWVVLLHDKTITEKGFLPIVLTNIVNGLAGGVCASVVNHSYGFAIAAGAFSQFILLALIEQLKTDEFKGLIKNSITEIIHAVKDLIIHWVERFKGQKKD